MSMWAEYLRVTQGELDRAMKDPGWALEYAEQVQDTQEEPKPTASEVRHFRTQCWDMLSILFRHVDFPVDVAHGEEPFAEEENWGYGPPKYLSAERVRVAADALSRIGYDELIQGVDPAELDGAQIYPPGILDDPEPLEWPRRDYSSLVTFFSAAARAGDALLVWLD
jgi:hypothetical protein